MFSQYVYVGKKMVMTWRGSGGTVEGGYCVFVTICEVWKYILTGR